MIMLILFGDNLKRIRESKNLSQSCARFKELVSQFNSGFQQLPEADK